MKKFYIQTFGCQMNDHDSNKIAAILEKEGYAHAKSYNDADIILLNTCSIREKAEHKIYSELGRIKKIKDKKSDLVIGVGGCVAQQEGEKLIKKIPYVDIVFGTRVFHKIPSFIRDALENKSKVISTSLDKSFFSDEIPEIYPAKRVSSYVSVMQGCNNFCTYCVVPYLRGREKSRHPDEIIKEVEALSIKGTKEVILLGQNVNSYGLTERGYCSFSDLIKKVSKVNGIERVRFVTSHPKDLSDDLITAFNEVEKLCPSMHLPVQSGSDSILQKMNRKYTIKNYLEKIEKIRKIKDEIAISTDIIVGFPGETEDDFSKTMNLLKTVEFDSLFAFKYSKRPNTEASAMENQIPEKIKEERLSFLLNMQKSITLKKNKECEGKIKKVLVERFSKETELKVSGRTECSRITHFSGSLKLLEGKIINIKITKAHQNSLSGEAAI